jgi:hypothetical protein
MTEYESAQGDDQLTLDAETWQRELLPDLSVADAELISELDREIIFDALVEFANREHQGIMLVQTGASQSAMSADAPLLIPGTRIHIQAGAVARDAVKRLVRIAAIFAVVGASNPSAAFVGLTVDLVLEIFEKTSRLDDVEVDIVRSLMELHKSSGDDFPTKADLGRTLPDVKQLGKRLNSLKARGVVASCEGGWKVTF